MAKKKQLSKGLSVVALLLGIVAIAMFFLPAIAVKNTDTTYSGLNAIFGYTDKISVVEVELFGFSVLNLLTFIFVILGTLLALIGLAGKKNNLLSFITAALLIVGGAMFFFMVTFSAPNDTMSSIVSLVGGNIKEGLSLAIGAIIGGAVSLLAGVIELMKLIVK